MTTMTSYLLLLALLCTLSADAFGANVTRKVGLAWGGNSAQVAQFEQTDRVSWFYNWGPLPSIPQTDLEFVPMFWGNRSIDTWVDTINDTLANYNVTAVLGMNEPNLDSQSNLTAQEGALLWLTYIQPLKARGLRLASPVPTNAPSGPQWLADFIGFCGPFCTIDIIALHWYGTNASYFIEYVDSVHNMFNRTIWLTEWDCQDFVNASDICSPEDVVQFMNITQDWMESSPFVERYSWFGAMTALDGVNPVNALMDNDGRINNLGLQYIGAGTFTGNASLPVGVSGSDTFLPSIPRVVYSGGPMSPKLAPIFWAIFALIPLLMI